MRTTIHDVARAAGTSITTVSRALNGTGRVSSRTRRTIIDLARDLDYRPGGFPAERVTYTVAVVASDLTNPFFPELLEAISLTINRAGSLMLVSPGSGWEALTALRRRRVDGMILIGAVVEPDRLRSATAGLPVVALDRPVELDSASIIRSDHAAGARAAAEHLIGLGHRRIAHVGGPAALEVARLRRDGVTAAVLAAGLPLEEELLLESDFDQAGGFRSVERLLDLDDRPTAVIMDNDLMAVGALSALETHRVDVPQEMSVIGFDDILLASYTRPRLTTVRQHAAALGTRAARLVLDLARGGEGAVPVTEILPVELVVRESTGPVPSGVTW